jgi:hypothetical protein
MAQISIYGAAVNIATGTSITSESAMRLGAIWWISWEIFIKDGREFKALITH